MIATAIDHGSASRIRVPANLALPASPPMSLPPMFPLPRVLGPSRPLTAPGRVFHRTRAGPAMLRHLYAAVVATLAGAAVDALGACRSDAPTAAPAADATARLQVVNASRAPVDVVIDGTVRVSTLPAASVSPLLAVDEGTRRVVVRPAGTATGLGAAQVTVQASGTALVAAQVGVNGALAAASLADTAAIPAPGTSKLRVLHLAPNAAAAGVWVLAPTEAAASADASCYSRVTPWRYGSSTSYLQSAPGSWDVVITPEISLGAGRCASAGTTNDTTPTTAGSARDPHAYATARLVVPVTAGQARTVVMLDASEGGVRVATTGAP